jgi:hypothetical protein
MRKRENALAAWIFEEFLIKFKNMTPRHAGNLSVHFHNFLLFEWKELTPWFSHILWDFVLEVVEHNEQELCWKSKNNICQNPVQ